MPSLFWEQGPQTASALREAHINTIRIPADNVGAWRNVAGIAAEPTDPGQAVKLITPGIEYFSFDASATQAPYIRSNGWRYLRNPDAKFFVNAPGAVAALAAAEGYVFGAGPMIQTDTSGVGSLGEMLAFLTTLRRERLPVRANIGFIDDGSPASAERMNLMIVRNLLFRRVTGADASLDLTVRPGSGDYPEAAWHNPDLLEHIVRSKLTDDKRLIRVYGTEVVIVRAEGDERELEVHLLNYAAPRREAEAIRVRVLGRYPRHKLSAFGVPGTELADFSVNSDVTEFTIPELKAYAVVELFR